LRAEGVDYDKARDINIVFPNLKIFRFIYAGKIRAEKLNIESMRDPAEFNDDVALRTEWMRMPTVTQSRSMFRLCGEPDGSEMTYKLSGAAYFAIWGCFIVLAGMAVNHAISAIAEGRTILTAEVLIICAVAFGVFFIARDIRASLKSRSIRFDLNEGCMIRYGHDRTSFKDIYALQLLTVHREDYVNYQLNAVLNDAGRVFIFNYPNKKTARIDAGKIARAIGLPVTRIWDCLSDYETVIHTDYYP